MSIDVSIRPETLAKRFLFPLFCLSGYLIAVAYGATFLLSSLVTQRGGNESDAGLIISFAMVSTIILVLLTGHISDAVGYPRAAGFSGLVLGLSCLGFAFAPGTGFEMQAFGLLLGCGWGVFYTLGPIIITTITPPEKRVRYFSLLSGTMMTGIGTGPIMGRLIGETGLPLEATFVVAAIACFLGGAIMFYLNNPINDLAAANGSKTVSRLSLRSAVKVLKAKSVFPIVMVGLGGAIFGGLSSFQTSYAADKGLDYSIFFIGFMSAAIGCRLLLAGIITRRDPHAMAALLTGLTMLSILLFLFQVDGVMSYLLAAIILGVGYGLTYSVINGQAANQAPNGHMPQSLMLFSLSYIVGVFGFPLFAGNLIVESGMSGLLYVILGISLVSFGISTMRLLVPSLR